MNPSDIRAALEQLADKRLCIEAEKLWSISSSLQILLTSFQAFQTLLSPNQSFQ